MIERQPRVGRYLIYGLLDPRDRCLRYVGKTHKRRELRLAEHIAHAREGLRAPVYDWIRTLEAEDLQPIIVVLERVAATADLRLVERRWIRRCEELLGPSVPCIYPAQTPKSDATLINRVDLLNVQGSD